VIELWLPTGPGPLFFAAMETLKPLISGGRFSGETSSYSRSLDHESLRDALCSLIWET